MIVGLIGSKTYTDKRKIEDVVLRLKKLFGKELVIASGGTADGAEYFVRKYCLEHSIKYREFNPAYTSYNSNSALQPGYYGKPYHGSQLLHRYFVLADSVNTAMIFIREEKELKGFFNTVIKRLERSKKESAVIV